MYQEFIPNLYLKKYIECIWSGIAIGENRIRIIPDGCMDIIIGVRKTGCISVDLVGTMTKHIFSLTTGVNYQIGIRFKPGGIYPLIREPLNQFNNKMVSLELISKDITTKLNRITELSSSIENTVFNIQQYLIKLFLGAKPLDNRISNSVEQILTDKGGNVIEKLSAENCLSIRQFERKFKSTIGISPKLLSRIVKFRNVYNYFNNEKKSDSLMNIAFDNNYFDNSHLTKDFKEFAGITPAAFFASK